MSEFSESNSVTKLIGTPPGYVGYEEGGGLTERIRRHPYGIVLFDEIEKAHTDVLDLFLQIADNGILTDSKGRKASFRNAYIIMTSNVGACAIKNSSVGFVTRNEYDCEKRVTDALIARFRPELVNRLDEIILFPPISLDDMTKIALSKLSILTERLRLSGIALEFGSGVAEYLAALANEERFGVRKLLRVIANEIENPLSSYIINNVSFDEKRIRVELVNGKPKIKEYAATFI